MPFSHSDASGRWRAGGKWVRPIHLGRAHSSAHSLIRFCHLGLPVGQFHSRWEWEESFPLIPGCSMEALGPLSTCISFWGGGGTFLGRREGGRRLCAPGRATALSAVWKIPLGGWGILCSVGRRQAHILHGKTTSLQARKEAHLPFSGVTFSPHTPFLSHLPGASGRREGFIS